MAAHEERAAITVLRPGARSEAFTSTASTITTLNGPSSLSRAHFEIIQPLSV